MLARKKLVGKISKRREDIALTVGLSVICGFTIWHVAHWHSIGIYLEMSKWVHTERAYIVVLYNLGLMLLLGAILGFLMEKITDLFSLWRNK
jgi:hypothetical protein